MKRIDVGILHAEQINFDLIGSFSCNGKCVIGEQSVVSENGLLKWNGNVYTRLHFVSQSPESRFLIHDVVIGVNFHWQRCEEQLFSGELILFVEDGTVCAVNRLPVEDYLVSVISSEMSASASLEFLKAHTVVSRSWLYAQLCRKNNVTPSVLGWENDMEIVRWYARENHKLFDLCADDHCQRYQGLTRAANPNVRLAVESTSGLVLAYDGEVCDARFSKCCGGITERFSTCWENIDYEYLQSFRDNDGKTGFEDLSNEENVRRWIETAPRSFCSTSDAEVLSQILNGYDCETNDFYRWSVKYSQSELSQLVGQRSGIDFGEIKDLQPVLRGASGRLVKLRIIGSKVVRVVGKELEIRRWLSSSHLYSSAFVVEREYDDLGNLYFTLKGAGWGHGVGLCQIGAAMMGERGFTYDKILKHYYPRAEIVGIDEIM